MYPISCEFTLRIKKANKLRFAIQKAIKPRPNPSYANNLNG